MDAPDLRPPPEGKAGMVMKEPENPWAFLGCAAWLVAMAAAVAAFFWALLEVVA
jgi:hypothetical protein